MVATVIFAYGRVRYDLVIRTFIFLFFFHKTDIFYLYFFGIGKPYGKLVSRYPYFHGVSHHIGLDTHDPGGDKAIPLAPGMIISDEPGLYIAEKNIGIRIEDDLLITENGCRVLTESIMKEVSDIEAFYALRK